MKRFAPQVLLVSIFSILVGLGMIFLVNPQLRIIANAQQEIVHLASQPVDTRVPKAPEATEATKQEYQQVMDLLPLTDSQYDLAVQIEALTRSAGLPLQSLSMNAAQANDPNAVTVNGLQVLSASLTTKGSYPVIEKLVAGLTTLERFTQINQVSLTNGPQDGDQVSALITVQAYYLPNPAVSTK